jgi:O-antigen/teichoic acid export membrane protein
MHPRKFIRDSVGYAVSQYLVRFLTTVRGLIAARLLGPAGYGSWNGLILLLEYGIYAPLGTYSALDQSVPARIVDGDAQRLDRVKRAGLFNVVISTTVFGALCLLYFARTQGQIRAVWGLSGVAMMVGCVALTNLSYYHLTLMRSHGNIAAVSRWWLLQGAIGVVLGLALIHWLGVWGLLWGWFTGTLVATLSVMRAGHRVVPLVPSATRESIALLRVGLPMFIFTASSFVMRSLDRVIILRFLGTEALGLYGLSVMAVGFLLTLPDAAAYVLYPQLVRRYREGGDAPAAIRDHVHRAMRAVSLAMPALCAIVYLGADDVVEWLLPRFRDGVPSLRILCFGAGGLALANLASIVLMTLGRQMQLVPVAVCMTAVGATLDLLAIHWGYGIRGVAWATFVTYALNSTVLITLAEWRIERSRGARLAFVARALAPLLLAIPMAWGFERLLSGYGHPGPMRVLRFLGAAAGWLVLYGLLMAPLARGIGLKRLLSEFNWPWSPASRRAGGPDGPNGS